MKHISNLIAGLAAGSVGGVLLAFAASVFIFGSFQGWIIPVCAVVVATCYVATRAIAGQPEERHGGAVREPGTDLNPHHTGHPHGAGMNKPWRYNAAPTS